MEISILKKIFENRDGPSKKMGQNFIVNPTTVKKMVSTANLSSSDQVLEIGPGTGVLTEEIIKKAKKIIAVEKDPFLVNILKSRFKDKGVKIINDDILNFKPENYFSKKYKIISNLPFYIATQTIRRFLEAKNPPESMTVIIQEEVARKITSKEKGSFLSVLISSLSDPEIVSLIPKSSFWPSPEVNGVMMKIKPHCRYFTADSNFYSNFFKVVESGFLHPRKQVKNNLSKLIGSKSKTEKLLEGCKIDPRIRPEKISTEEWIKITKKIFDFES